MAGPVRDMEKVEVEDQRMIEVGSDQGVNEDGSRVGCEGGAEAVVVTKVKSAVLATRLMWGCSE